ncbi:Gfo/Idh/MocA family protein [Actinokineospora soli]|uniref:Gfo/Idh/MocA family protein n=1 Tax=Actinokineospora soli TaxID=1048753 RepID=A0ABW2TTD4_9PSEU
MTRRRYAFVGTGHRAQLYFDALLGPHAADGVPIALCDSNPGRVEYYQRLWRSAGGTEPLRAYAADEYAAMLRDERPDAVVVTSVDAAHADHAVAALDRGVDVIVEKPLTTDAEGCARIAEAARRSAARLVVTFNYRYSPRNSEVKRLLLDGAVGEVTAVHFEWVLDTVHGADYFRRWHRVKANSGGLFVHKASHHFDLVNWWLDDVPRWSPRRAACASTARRTRPPTARRSPWPSTPTRGCTPSTASPPGTTATAATRTCSRPASPSRTPCRRWSGTSAARCSPIR